jgi:Organic solvent tolerance protein OstA
MKRVSFLCFAFLLLCSLPTIAQQQNEEDIVRLISADTIQHLKSDNGVFRKAWGSARFLHNKTYILCDTATWDMQNNIIDAKGHVQVIQERTRLTGETIHYRGDDNWAEVRGNLVELFDDEGNRLRTNYLDFNTKDSIGIFRHGGSMVDKDGGVLESLSGYYYSKEKRFHFQRSVEMCTDTVQIQADSVNYHTDIKRVIFGGNVRAWHTAGYLTAQRGYYDRDIEHFHFFKDVYLLGEKQEIWADTLFYNRAQNAGSLYGNIQILDTLQSIILLGDEGHFQQNPQKALLTKKPAFLNYGTDDKGVVDTLFFRADTLAYHSLPKHAVDSAELQAAESRLKFLLPPPQKDSTQTALNDSLQVAEPPQPLPDSLAPPLLQDSLQRAALPDSLASAPPPPLDTTAISFLRAYPKVQFYRSNGQGVCDSLVFNGLDSTLRMYGRPALWHEKNQFTADSIQFWIHQGQINRADLFSSAYIVAQEDSLLYNQIKGKDMIGYFRDNDVYRFDVLDAVEVILFMREGDDNFITSLNQKESKTMTAFLKERQVQSLRYYTDFKTKLIPLVQTTDKDQRLTNFVWRAEERPLDRYTITTRHIRPSAALTTHKWTKPRFLFSQRYFPEHPLPGVQR